ncbi:MAG: hypothetical protein MJK04_11765, partial [Psychrosphaera sp.]|nr:hypothetical protein [Psychrosphaera sp.]
AGDIFDLGELHFETVSTPEQIPDGLVTALAQDTRGFIWVGTQNGLFRYDGYQFRKLDQITQNTAAPLGIFITSLYAANDGRLWIGSLSDGASVYDPVSANLSHWAVQPGSTFGLSHNRVEAIVGDKAGNIWIGTNDGLDKIDGKTGDVSHYQQVKGDANSLNDHHIRALLIDNKDRLWVGSWNGLNRLKPGGGGFESVFSEPPPSLSASPPLLLLPSLAQQRVDSLYQSVDGNIWVGTQAAGAAWITPDGQFHRIGVDPGNKDLLSHPWVHTISQPNENTLWLGTRDGGINVVDAQNGQVSRRIRHDPAITTSLAFDDIGALLVDHSGLQWIGTWGGGLIRHNPANRAFRTLHHSPYNDKKLSYADIGSILALDDGTIWVGTHGNGIDIINPDVGVVDGIRPGALADGTVIALAETPDRMIWIGTQQAGLYRFDRRDKTLRQYTLADGLIDLHVRRILFDGQNGLWIGTYGGLSRFDMTTETFDSFTTVTQPDTAFSETIYTLAIQADGTLWVGADNGLYRLPPNSQKLTQVHHVPK